MTLWSEEDWTGSTPGAMVWQIHKISNPNYFITETNVRKLQF